MNIQQTREWVKDYYRGSKTWARKVDAMSDGQVIAIFLRLQKKAS